MTRVLVVHQPTDGGVGRHVADLATGLDARGFEVVMCGPDVPTGTPSTCEHVKLDLERRVGPHDATMLRRLSSLVRALRPDVVHAHSSKAGALARLSRVLGPRLPLVYTPHGYAFAGYFRHELERSAYRGAERVLARLATRVLCVCEAEAELARTVGPAGRIRVVYNGIDPGPPGKPNAQMRELRARGPVLCTLTLLRPGKGLESLIDATPIVLERHPRAQIAVWGVGADMDVLRARAAERGVDASVHFLGSTTDPLSALRGAEAFVLPSWAEAFPYAILEAMSIGLPTVATNVGGIAEALRDGQDGVLVPKGDASALAIALSGLLDDPDRARRMGETALQRLQQRFSREQMIDGVMHVYAELQSNSRTVSSIS